MSQFFLLVFLEASDISIFFFQRSKKKKKKNEDQEILDQ